MKIKVIIILILIQLFIIQNNCFSIENEEKDEMDEKYNVLLAINILGPLIGLYSGDVELRLNINSSLRIGFLYLNPILNILNNIITIELEVTSPDGTIKKYTEDFYIIGTYLQYNVLLNNYFPNSIYLGFGTSYAIINLDDNNNPELSGIYNKIAPFVLLGLQAINNNILTRIELGLKYSFATVKVDELFTSTMFDISKAEGFEIYFGVSIGFGL
jgi:hypothetical protein